MGVYKYCILDFGIDISCKLNLSSVFNNVKHACFNASVLAAKFKL